MELKLPELGEGVHEGELLKWKVKPGDTIKHDHVLAEIMTDKATVELPAPFDGTISELTAKEGTVVHVGQVILKYEPVGGAAKAAPTQAAAPAHATAPATSAPAASKAPAHLNNKAPAHLQKNGQKPAPMAAAPAAARTETEVTLGGTVQAAPATRRLAREMGIDLGQVRGSGPNGRIMKEDLENAGTGAVSAGAPKFARSGAAPQQREEIIPFRGLRKKISEKMRQSKDHAAHFTYVEEADATALVELRARAKEIGQKQGVKVTYLPIVMKAMVAALKQFPIMNSELKEESGEIVVKHYYNIGLSVQTEDGLTAPVVKNVESKSILEIARDIEDLVNRARMKKLTMDDLTGGTITLTNAGSIGGLFATPVINYPEVAILGFNKIFRKPVVKTIGGREEIVIRDWTYFSISLDHRIVDGAIAAEFMKVFINYIENPALLLMDSL